MTSLTKALKNHHDMARTRREVGRAIDHAATPGMRTELLTMAQRQGLRMR